MGCGASTATPSGAKPAKNRTARLKEVFAAMDADGSGTVDMNEFLATAKGGEDQMQIQMMFHFMDGQKSSDGSVTLAEWISGMNMLNSSDEAFEKEMDAVMEVLKTRWMRPALKEMDAASAAPPVPKLDMSKLKKQPIREFSGDEIRDVLAIFKQFDENGDGVIDAAELSKLAAALMIEVEDGEMDNYSKDGKIQPREFFAYYVGCTAEEAESAFLHHSHIFTELRKKGLKEWSAAEVKDVLTIFKQFDKDGDSKIDNDEFKELTAVLGLEEELADSDTLVKDGVIDMQEFFAFYTGCTEEEAANAFDQHTLVFATGGA